MMMMFFTYGEKEKFFLTFLLLTCGFVFRMRFDCALSSSDSDALERRLGNRLLLLRHPQVSNQNSKRADRYNQSDEKWSTPGLWSESFLFWSTLPLSPPPIHIHSALFHFSSPN